MSFMDSLGEGLGKMAAKAQEIQKYKSEYERMSNNTLIAEYKRLKKESDGWLASEESRLRLSAVKSVLYDRGYGRR